MEPDQTIEIDFMPEANDLILRYGAILRTIKQIEDMTDLPYDVVDGMETSLINEKKRIEAALIAGLGAKNE